ncbi:hypothetical protein BSL78_29020 [Apostichopus japonicus]|uniref:Calcineurin-binding protein cabin-1 n=1 Tax=Stichopus japonicus TaxID=307972 RepID=A0A2G8JEG4_STIJA|nr:hypothetical protein BSL78_29020 [Apostichopus japonicus]
MLGKISEKRGEMNVALRHYLEAMEHLHSDGAKFPKKISYHNPPDLALESVEMYFRIHAAVLKYLKKNQSSSTDAEQDGVKLALPPVLHSSRSNSPRYFTAPRTTTTPGGCTVNQEAAARRKYRQTRHQKATSNRVRRAPRFRFRLTAFRPIGETCVRDAGRTAPSSETKGNAEAAEKKPETAAVAELEKKEEPVPMDTKEKEKEASVAGPQTEELSAAERFKRLVEQSISAMHLCLQRFPQHYKSLYRIAHWHLTSATEKGIWRIPIADIDRSGSFSWHMYRSVTLLIEVLEELKDEAMLLQLATKLARTPEQGKKFLRDSDRPHLATRAYQTCQKLLAEETGKVSSLTETESFNLLMKIWQTLSVGQQLHHAGDSKVASKLLTAVYKSYKGKEIEDEPSVYDQASRFCQHVVNTSKLPQTPTQGDYHRFVRPSHLGSPVKAPSSPGPGKSSEKINQPPTSDKGPPQRSLTTASQGPASQVKKSPEVPLGSSFLMSSILAPDTERKKPNQGMRTVPFLDDRGEMATKGDIHPHPQQDDQSKPKSAGHAIAIEATSGATATFGASGGAIMSSQTEKSLGDDKTRGDSQPDRLEKEGDFSGESSSILGDASQEGVGDAQPPSKTEVSIGQVKSVSNPDRPIGESDPEEPRIGIFESLALPKRDFLEPTKRVVPSLEGKDKDGKGPKAKPAGVSYLQSGQEESKFKLKDESKVAVAEQQEMKQSSGGIVKHRPAKIPHLVEIRVSPVKPNRASQTSPKS